MCFGGRDKNNGEAARSRELDRMIRQDEKRMQKEVKLLLLGKHRSPCMTQQTSGWHIAAIVSGIPYLVVQHTLPCRPDRLLC